MYRKPSRCFSPRFHSKRHVLIGVMAIALGGCASVTDRGVAATHDGLSGRANEATSLLRAAQTRPAYVREETLPRFASRMVPVEPGTALPATGVVTARYPGRHTLLSVADIVTRLTGIPVVVTPDALLSPSDFAPGGAQATTGLPAREAPVAGLAIRNLPDHEYLSTFELNYSGSLAGLLESIAKRGGLNWRYDNGTITFSRVISRIFDIKSLAGGLAASGAIAINPGDAGSSMNVNVKAEGDIWANLEAVLGGMVSKAGRLHLDHATGIVSVRDAAPNVDEVKRYIDYLNATALRQVTLNVEVLQVNLSANHERGIDWDYVSKVLASRGNAVVSLTGPSTNLPSSPASGVGIAVRSSSGATANALVRVLEEFGSVSSSYSSVVTTINRMPVPIGVLNQRAYLKSVAPGTPTETANGAVSVGAPTLTPGQISTGFAMTITPLVLESNRLLVQTSLSISRLRELIPFSSGSGSNQATIQTPDVDVFNSMQRSSLVPGETLVLAGYESVETTSTARDLVRGAIPSSRVARQARTSTVILITPRLMDY